MLALNFQQFATRGQKIDLLRFLVELLGKRGDRLDHMLTAIENDKKLSRTNEVDQLQAGIFRFECNSHGCRDSPHNVPRIGKAFQVNKMDIPAKILGSGAADSQGNGRLANAAGAEQGYEPLISKLVANLADERFAPNHHDRPHGEPALVPELIVPAFRAASERDDGADERVAPSLDVCDVTVAELAVTKRFADRGHVDPEAPLLDRYVRPDVVDQLLLCDHLTWTLGKVDQDVERPAAKGQHHTLAPQQPFANRKFERAELQLSISSSVRHGFKALHEIRAHLRDVIHLAGRLCAPARSAGSGRNDQTNGAKCTSDWSPGIFAAVPPLACVANPKPAAWAVAESRHPHPVTAGLPCYLQRSYNSAVEVPPEWGR